MLPIWVLRMGRPLRERRHGGSHLHAMAAAKGKPATDRLLPSARADKGVQDAQEDTGELRRPAQRRTGIHRRGSCQRLLQPRLTAQPGADQSGRLRGGAHLRAQPPRTLAQLCLCCPQQDAHAQLQARDNRPRRHRGREGDCTQQPCQERRATCHGETPPLSLQPLRDALRQPAPLAHWSQPEAI